MTDGVLQFCKYLLMEPMMKNLAVIGAGITGITTAYQLKERGYDVCVFDKNRYAAMETSLQMVGNSQHVMLRCGLVGLQSVKVYYGCLKRMPPFVQSKTKFSQN
jgi:ribulose 1,5-bisphosphate synthetase/thiazole synthase